MSAKRRGKKNNLPQKSLSKRESYPESKEGDDGKFTDILHRNFKIYRVSPLYNFARSRLKEYEKILNGNMNSSKKLTCFGYKSKVNLNKNLRLNSECPDALQVEIIKDDSQRVYTGHFVSWSTTKTDTSGSVCLPILLVEGKEHEVDGVHSCLSKIFDCDIQPVTFSFYAMIAFFVKLLETPRTDIDVSQAEVTLQYKVPGCEANDKIEITFVLESTILVHAVTMESLKEKNPGITPMEIIVEFYNKLLNHAYHVYEMNLMAAELHKITFPDGFLTSEGQLKISTPEAAVSAFEVLQCFTPLDAVTAIGVTGKGEDK